MVKAELIELVVLLELGVKFELQELEVMFGLLELETVIELMFELKPE